MTHVIKQEAEPADVGLDAVRLGGLGNHFRRYVDDGPFIYSALID